MKTWIKRTLIGVLGAGVLLGGLAACANHRGHHGWAMGEADIAKMRERVVDKASRSVLDYGSMGGMHPGFLDHVPAVMHHNGD